MYQLMIVEDEDIIRAGIKKIIQEMDLGFAPLLEASNGNDALEIAKHNHIDIVVTDIKMDNGDGLALIRNLAQANIRVKSIILSGYGQFAYAQQAISLGVGEYLLKPIKKKNLYEALSKLIEQLDSEKKLSSPLPTVEPHSLPQQRALLAIAQGKYAASDLPALLDSERISMSSGYFVTVSVYTCNNLLDANDVIARITGQSHRTTRVLAACEAESGYALLLIGMNEAASMNTRQFHSDMLGLLAEHGFPGDPALPIGISDYAEQPEMIPRLIEQSAYALDFRLLRPNIRYFYYKDTVPLDPPTQVPNVFLQSIGSALREGNLRAMSEAVDGWFRLLQQQPDATPSFVVDTFYNLLVYSEFTRNKEQDWNSRTHSDLTRMYRNSATLDEFKDFLKQRFTRGVHKGTAIRNTPFDSNAISFIIKYLELHYDQDITLRSAAEQIFMNPSYFSTLFKKKTGINFVHYLQKLRIEKSKDLLQDPKYKIYEVATKIGFTDEKYFFKVFKNVTGITPNEYRDKRDFV